MVKEKVSARVLTADAPELNFRGKKKTGKVDSFPMKSLQPPHKIEVWQGPIVF